MKRLFTSVILAVVVFTAAAQNYEDPFEEFAAQSEKTFSDFRQDADRSFSDLMEKAWKAFDAMDALEAPRRPGPVEAVYAPVDSLPSGRELPCPKMIRQSHHSVQYVPGARYQDSQVKRNDVSAQGPKPGAADRPLKGRTYRFVFYGNAIEVDLPEGFTSLRLNETTIKGVKNYWSALEKFPLERTLSQISAYEASLSLTGWTRCLLVDGLVNSVFTPAHGAEASVFKTYLLNRMGMDVKLASADGLLTAMVAIKEKAYSRMFVDIAGRRYYLEPTIRKVDKLYSYDVDMSEGLRPVSLVISKPLTFSTEGSSNRQSTIFGNQCSIRINENVCRCYNDFPQSDLYVYARSAADPEFSAALLKAFRTSLSGKGDYEKVSALLKYMHEGFTYASDQEQFGYEKPFFLEENYVYPYNDCEDRSLLLSTLVRKLVGLDVVLMDYKDHVSVAVAFDDQVQGDYFTMGGRRYVVCDPTYIGAPVGMVMGKYAEAAFDIIRL